MFVHPENAPDPGKVYVKICGLARLDDAKEADRLGADLLGMVFHPGSPRACDLEVARQIRGELPSRPRVLVFSHDPVDLVMDIYASLRDMLTFIQLPADHTDLKKLTEVVPPGRIFPSVAVHRQLDDADLEYLSAHSLLVLDTPAGNPGDTTVMAGGTGRTFDWQRAGGIDRPFLLAGGLTPGNVAQALEAVNPLGVDVSSGVEAEPGKKDHGKMHDFFRSVHSWQN